jgi:hypothetical protein
MKLAFFLCALLLLGAAQDASQDFDNEDEEFERAPASIPTPVATNIPKVCSALFALLVSPVLTRITEIT